MIKIFGLTTIKSGFFVGGRSKCKMEKAIRQEKKA